MVEKNNNNTDSTTRFRSLLREAEQGNAEAQCEVGLMYKAGNGVEKNWDYAVEWLNKAAVQGHSGAAYEVVETLMFYTYGSTNNPDPPVENTSITNGLNSPEQSSEIDNQIDEDKWLDGLIEWASHHYWVGWDRIPRDKDELRKLKKLDLSLKEISYIPSEITLLDSLEELDLSDWKRGDELLNDLGLLKKLKKLNLQNTGLSSFPLEIAEMSELEELDLSDNYIGELPEGIRTLYMLKVLKLRNNNIVELTEQIDKLCNLEKLDLSNNRLKTVPMVVRYLSKLRKLDLSKNSLTDLPPGLETLSELEELDVSYNQLSNLPEEVSRLPRLKSLRTAGNNMTNSASDTVEIQLYALRDDANNYCWIAGAVDTETFDSDTDYVLYLRFSLRCDQIPEHVDISQLSTEQNEADCNFVSPIMVMAKALFEENATFIQNAALPREIVFKGKSLFYSIYVQCSEQHTFTSERIRKEFAEAIEDGSLVAMAFLADIYLVGSGLPQNTEKALYWFNSLVEAGRKLGHGKQVTKKEEIVSGGIYASRGNDSEQYTITKVLLADKQGVQKLIYPRKFDQLPLELNPLQLIEASSKPDEDDLLGVMHIPVSYEGTLKGEVYFMGLLPISEGDIEGYKVYLKDMFGMEPSPFDKILQEAEAGDAYKQNEAGRVYLMGHSDWGVEIDYTRAMYWLKKAADNGHG